MEDEQLFHKVSKWANMLAREEKIEHALRRLESVKIDLRLLTETGVGKAVNSLRKHPNWGSRVSALVARWKDVALAENARIAAESEKHQKSCESEGNDDCNNSDGEDGNNQRHYNDKGNKRSKEILLEKKHKRSKSLKNNFEEDNGPIDAFSAQLTAADRICSSNERRRKIPRISAETIQNSLLESLSNPLLLQSGSGSHKNYQATHPNSIDSDINMFKAPKENRRVYAGKKKNGEITPQVPHLFDICIRILINNVDAIEETGDIPFDILKPVLERANSTQLYKLEEKNPYLQEDTDYLWKQHCEREFAKQLSAMVVKKSVNSSGSEDEDEDEDEEGNEDCYEDDGLTWRERFAKFLHEREYKLRRLSKKINLKTTEMVEPQRKAMETAPIAPRHIRKRQIKNGMIVNASSVPTAIELTRARRQIFETGNDANFRQMPSAIRNTKATYSSRSSDSFASISKKKPQRGPLMIKTLKMLKMQKR